MWRGTGPSSAVCLLDVVVMVDMGGNLIGPPSKAERATAALFLA